MNNLILLISIGAILFFMFRKGGMAGMGCCGGHGHHEASDSGNTPANHSGSDKENPQIIDLNEADYTVLPSKRDER